MLMVLQCFLIHSGVDEFPAVVEEDLLLALAQLQGTGATLLFHAESEVQFEMCSEKRYNWQILG